MDIDDLLEEFGATQIVAVPSLKPSPILSKGPNYLKLQHSNLSSNNNTFSLATLPTMAQGRIDQSGIDSRPTSKRQFEYN